MKKGLVRVLIANIINLLIGLVNSFILPKYLSVESYAMIKTYTLYIGYAGFFHLGYLDGMYLKYGGKNLKDIDSKDISTDFKNIVLMQLIVSIVVFLTSLLRHDSVLKLFSIGLFLTNVISFYQMLFQASGEFALYSKTLNYRQILIVLLNLALLFLVKTNSYILYIGSRVFVAALMLVYLGIVLVHRSDYLERGKVSLSRFKENISSGFVLMLGNFSSNMFTAIDRWFVKFLMATQDFAIYSFAVTIDSLITVFITPISIILYNSLCRNSEVEYVKKLKRMTLIWGFMIIAAAFPAKWVLEHYIAKYVDSAELIFMLFATQAMYTVIKGVYVNLYKAQKKQNQYFRQMIIMTIIAAVLDGGGYYIFRSRLSLAVCTLLTAFIWLLICEFKNPEMRFSKSEWITFAIEMATFLICGTMFNPIFGLAVYAVISLTTVMLIMRKDFLFMISSMKDFILHRSL